MERFRSIWWQLIFQSIVVVMILMIAIAIFGSFPTWISMTMGAVGGIIFSAFYPTKKKKVQRWAGADFPPE